MKMIYYSFIALLTINTINAQQSSNLNTSFLSEKPVIANLNYNVLPTTVNTDESNIALGNFKDKFVISSYKKYPHASVLTNKDTKERVPNIMCTSVEKDYDLKYPIIFSRFLKSDLNEGSITFNDTFDEAFLPRKKNRRDKEYYLFRTKLVDRIAGIWSEPVEVLFDNRSIPMTTPRINKNNSLIYFSADLPEGYGGQDIYSAEYDHKAQNFKNVKNLGPAINTPHNEINAVDEGNFIYFSSDMPGGFGGYDVYRITNKDGEYSFKINVGDKINTPKDEVNMIPITKTEGYFTSSKDKQQTFDIFRYSIVFEDVAVKTRFIDEKRVPIRNLPVEILNEDGEIIFNGVTDQNGMVAVSTTPYSEINYAYTSDKYYNDTRLAYSIVDDNPEQNYVIQLNEHKPKAIKVTEVLKPVVNLREIGKQNSIFFGFDKYNVTQNQWKKVIYIANALKEHPDVDVVVEGYADKRGKASYNYKLTEKRVNSVVNLLIKQGIDKNRIIELPMGSTTPIIKCVKCTEAQNAQNRRVLFDFKTE